ncbi:DUF551 domain-containing protein [Enterobacter kobei]|uniref:DUF551 domain-containing protein n=1 Tax=Enterobacter kobei TaxID=208224 RepID=UPI003075EFBC
MSTITKERIANLLQFNSEGSDCQANAEQWEVHELARIALASLEAEPVAWLLSGGGAKNHVSFDSGNAYADPLREVTPLYASPPAPVSVPAAMEMDDDFDSAFEHGKAVGWNACRAAMLQGAEPVTPAYKSPDDFDFDRFNDVVWLEAVASNPHMHSLTTSTIAMVALELNRKLADCNSPVIQDGWVACVERMPSAGEQVLAYRPDAPESNDPLIKMATYVGGSAHGHGFDCYCKPTHWMPLPAAPQQELK